MFVGVGFSTKYKWWAIGARLVEWAEMVPFSHCYVITGRSEDKATWCVFEAVWPKARAVSYVDWIKQGNFPVLETRENLKSDVELRHIENFLGSMVGTSYSAPQLLLIAAQFMGMWLRRGLARILKPIEYVKLVTEDRLKLIEGPSFHANGTRSIICSELVARFIEFRYGDIKDPVEHFDFVSLADVFYRTAKTEWDAVEYTVNPEVMFND